MSDIDTNLPEVEQWNKAVLWWKELRNIWSAEAVSRGFKVTSPTPNLGDYCSCRLYDPYRLTFSSFTTQTPVSHELVSGRQA